MLGFLHDRRLCSVPFGWQTRRLSAMMLLVLILLVSAHVTSSTRTRRRQASTPTDQMHTTVFQQLFNYHQDIHTKQEAPVERQAAYTPTRMSKPSRARYNEVVSTPDESSNWYASAIASTKDGVATGHVAMPDIKLTVFQQRNTNPSPTNPPAAAVTFAELVEPESSPSDIARTWEPASSPTRRQHSPTIFPTELGGVETEAPRTTRPKTSVPTMDSATLAPIMTPTATATLSPTTLRPTSSPTEPIDGQQFTPTPSTLEPTIGPTEPIDGQQFTPSPTIRRSATTVPTALPVARQPPTKRLPTTMGPTALPTEPIDGQQDGLCAAFPKCGVTLGDCCPTAAGIMLDCCDGMTSPGVEDLLLFSGITFLSSLDGYTIDLNTVDEGRLVIVATTRVPELISLVRFTIAEEPSISVIPNSNGQFVLGPLGDMPFPDLLKHGSSSVTAAAYSATDTLFNAVTATFTIVAEFGPTESPIGTSFMPTQEGASCALYPSCPRDRGDCCPTRRGIVLPCCNPSHAPTQAPTEGSPTRNLSLDPTSSPNVSQLSISPTVSASARPVVFSTLEPTDSLMGQQETESPTPQAAPTGQQETESPTTSPPTTAPTATPTRQLETDSPTREPMEPPTRRPTTKRPTPAPTRELTGQQETDSPTREPTEPPTKLPQTESPSKGPTLISTRNPTNPPSIRPSFPPIPPSPLSSSTLSPTVPPTRRPTFSPTKRPTVRPSPSPTNVPVTVPTTVPPTKKPNFPPTQKPTSLPTNPPTSPPSTDSPSHQPAVGPTTAFPTLNTLSSRPTEHPSKFPILISSESPTKEGNEFRLTSFNVKNVQLELRRTTQRRLQQIEPCGLQLWTGKVQQAIKDEIDQKVPRVEESIVQLLNARSETRNDVLSLVFDVSIGIRAPLPPTELEIERYIAGPYDIEAEKRDFAEFLRRTNCQEFRTVESVGNILIPSSVKTPNAETPSTGPDASLVGLVVGLGLAGVAIVLLAATFIYLRTRRQPRRHENEGVVPLVYTHPEQDNNEYASQIGFGFNNDISTLGDPIPNGAAGVVGDQSTIGSQSLEYDYQKAFVDQNSLTDSRAEGGHSRLMTLATPEDPALAGGMFGGDVENDSLDSISLTQEQYEVIAPAGLLGLILESNLEDGRPMVNNVKPSSVLSNVVKIGDRLLSVDGADVTKYSANDVSHLLASKKDQESRVMVFERNTKRFSVSEGTSVMD